MWYYLPYCSPFRGKYSVSWVLGIFSFNFFQKFKQGYLSAKLISRKAKLLLAKKLRIWASSESFLKSSDSKYPEFLTFVWKLLNSDLHKCWHRKHVKYVKNFREPWELTFLWAVFYKKIRIHVFFYKKLRIWASTESFLNYQILSSQSFLRVS